jgi:hypothetical protein
MYSRISVETRLDRNNNPTIIYTKVVVFGLFCALTMSLYTILIIKIEVIAIVKRIIIFVFIFFLFNILYMKHILMNV